MVITKYLLVIIYVMILSYGVLGNHPQELQALISEDQHNHTPKLEDFFWTGSGDGPPAPVLTPEEIVPSQVTQIRTTTVLATVYLDSIPPPKAVTDKTTGECISNCEESSVTPGSLTPEVSEDRRYWLLTVIQGSAPDSLQLRLARLYQKAFLRQQERHLGIIKSLDASTTRKKHDVNSFSIHKRPSDPHQIENRIANLPNSEPSQVNFELDNKTTVLSSTTEEDLDMYPANVELLSIENNNNNINIKATKLSDIKSWILVTPTAIVNKRDLRDREELSNATGPIYDSDDIESDNGTALFKREIIKPEQQPPVHVHIQNVTESLETGTVEIVYVVLVGGRAVPATVAARDMRLVRDAEVATELGAVVTTKAEHSNLVLPAAYLKAAEDLSREATTPGISGTELWALGIGAAVAAVLLVLLILLLCRLIRRRKSLSAASLRAYKNELIREIERNQLKQVHEEKDGKLISVVSPSRTRPSSTILPIYRAASASSTSTTSSGVTEMAAALRRRQKKPHALKMPQKKRVGTTDSLLEAAGIESSDSAKELSEPSTPTSYLSMPSVRFFPRGNLVEPLSKVLEPISVRHLDLDSPIKTPKPKPRNMTPLKSDVVPRRQMASQLVRLGSIDKDPGVVGPMVWDLHCQRIKEASKPSSPTKSTSSGAPSMAAGSVLRMRQRFNELVDDAFSLFTPPIVGNSQQVHIDGKEEITQARNDNVRLPGSPYTALDTVRGKSAGVRSIDVASKNTSGSVDRARPRTTLSRPTLQSHISQVHYPSSSRAPVPEINPAFILSEGRLPPQDPALPLISDIKTEITRIRQNAQFKG